MNEFGADTTAVWGGEEARDFWQGATQVPVVDSVAFGYRDLDEWQAVALQQRAGHIYSRNTNPTVQVFEARYGCSSTRKRRRASRPAWRRSAARCSRC